VRRALLAGAVLLVCLLAMEASLQLASLVLRGLARRAPTAAAAQGTVTILCVGDSHTFGLPLPEEESYPAQLEQALLDARPDVRFRVVNLGIPGVNSAFVANRLARQLFQLEPQLVVVWVGVNNIWNRIETKPASRAATLQRMLLHSRLFRLASIAWYGAIGHRYDPKTRGGWYEGEAPPSGRPRNLVAGADPAPGLAEDMERMRDLAWAVDVPILFVTYPLPAQQPLSKRIAQIGERLGVDVIDTAVSLARARAEGHGRSDLVDERAGPHPTGLLYAHVVEDMLPRVLATLEVWHGI